MLLPFTSLAVLFENRILLALREVVDEERNDVNDAAGEVDIDIAPEWIGRDMAAIASKEFFFVEVADALRFLVPLWIAVEEVHVDNCDSLSLAISQLFLDEGKVKDDLFHFNGLNCGGTDSLFLFIDLRVAFSFAKASFSLCWQMLLTEGEEVLALKVDSDRYLVELVGISEDNGNDLVLAF